jgi:hypothetical protein
MQVYRTGPRLFLSHSSSDKQFVRRLVADLKALNLNVWIDEQELRVGDSIVQGISAALTATDYLLIVLSEASTKSKWVQAELNAALMAQLSNGGTVVLPVRIDDSIAPPLLRDRLYADFRHDYQAGLRSLVEVFNQESPPTDIRESWRTYPSTPLETCTAALIAQSDADVRRRIHLRLDRTQIRAVWHAVLDDDMNDHMEGRDKLACALDLVIRSRRLDLMERLYVELCKDHPTIGQV